MNIIPSNFVFHLSNSTVEEICPLFHRILSISKSDSLHSALNMLIENKISSVPVYEEDRTKFLFFIDFLDILSFIIDDLDNAEKIRNILHNTTCGQCRPRDSQKITISKKSTIQEAIDLFTRFNGTLNRVAVLDENGIFESILTQSRIVRYIGNRPDYDIGDIKQKTVEEIGIGNAPVVSVDKDEIVMNAFKKMYHARISGIAVIKEDNKLLGNISLSDLKAIGPNAEMASKFKLTAKEFIMQNEMDSFPKLVVVKRSELFQNVFWNLRSAWTHRIYVIDDEENRRCLKVITIFDILKMFSSK